MSIKVDQSKVQEIKSNLESVQSRINKSAKIAGRDPSEIKLVAVTKTLPVETISAGIEAGLRCFGENYAEHAAEKIEAIKTDLDIEWHMIGHIQSRKAETVCQYFDMVHSLDRIKIARYLDRYAKELQRIMPVLIEVNLSGEESKYGWEASDETSWSDLIPQFEKIANYENLEIRGLMTMPPLFDDPEETRPIYQRLKQLQAFLRHKMNGVSWDALSIGTSFDFQVAIEEGATIVRIGAEIFGSRPIR
jgi:pyridoxal phosphate enzyme (YggS family)